MWPELSTYCGGSKIRPFRTPVGGGFVSFHSGICRRPQGITSHGGALYVTNLTATCRASMAHRRSIP